MKRFTFWRNAIVSEYYEVEAESEEQAAEQLVDGCHEPVHTEWMEWADRGYSLDSVEIIDPLYLMIKQHTQKETA